MAVKSDTKFLDVAPPETRHLLVDPKLRRRKLQFDDINVVPPIPRMVDDPSVLAQGALELNEAEIDEGSAVTAAADNSRPTLDDLERQEREWRETGLGIRHPSAQSG
eukprot:gb/GECG01014071.1/.p1 GENE.gb/GECG01014071.1/~~gb/GECG01014071.1/.p1  ORF type:complete len:107 (+),score=19.77 gb/GECG01014071.1/:1-321(+)